MNNSLKAAKLDFSLAKPYSKSIAFSLAFPVVFAVISRSLLNSVSFAMCYVAMTSGYTFSISEKNGMERLYGVLPVSKKSMVLGKYLYTCTMGMLALLISLAVHPIALHLLGETVLPLDIIAAAMTGIVTFSLYTVFLLPGYYKYGAIKGRLFMFVPVAGYLAVLAFISKIDFANNPVLSTILNNPIILLTVILLVCITAFSLSMLVSIRILQNKEV